jgi:hypothetical protein
VAGYHPLRGGRYDNREDRTPTPENARVQSGDPHGELPPTLLSAYHHHQVHGGTDPRVWLNDYRLAGQLGGVTTDAVIIHNLPLHLADSPGRGSSICSTTRSTVGTTWSAHLWETSRARTCASGTPGTYWGALRSPACRCGTSYDAFPSAILLMVKFRQPSHEFTFGVGMTFVSYPLVLTPVV